MKSKNRLKDLGEFAFIDMVNRILKTDSSVIKGIGDDTAVLKYTKDKYLLFTSDMIIEGAHFRRKAKPECIGHKALACNISDIASMGGLPTYALVSVGLPANLDIGFAKKIYIGMNRLAKKFNINVVGGDTNKAKEIIINVALSGEIEKRKLVLRSNASLGDLIFVSGTLGGAFKKNRHMNFVPRLKEARFLVNNYKINSMIDISDGLISDLNHILSLSKKGAIVYEDLIPKYKNTTTKEALYTGEDYELLFTMSKGEAARLIKNSAKKINLAPFTNIGMITNKKFKIEFVERNKNIKILKPAGYRHF